MHVLCPMCFVGFDLLAAPKMNRITEMTPSMETAGIILKYRGKKTHKEKGHQKSFYVLT
jgi:hypothetical protein